MESTSPTLMLRLKEDGPVREIAWGEFRRLYAPVIAGFARRLGVLAPADVDDLIQDVLLGFYAAQPKFTYEPARGRLRGYLKTCVVHLLSRKAARGKLVLDRRPVDEFDVADPAVERAWAATWEREHLNRGIDRVREQVGGESSTFRAFHRVAIEQADPAAVADELGISVNAVYQARKRCLAALRSVLEQYEDAEG